MHSYATLATAVYKRAVVSANPGAPETPTYELPSWTWLVFLLNLIYTIRQVYPVLAIVENENPPAYEPVSLNDDSASLAEDNGVPKPAGVAVPSGNYPSHTVTSSLRGCHRLLRASGGFRANFRGFSCLFAQGMMTYMLMGIFSSALGYGFSSIATLLASLSLVQFSAAWVHVVISQPSPLHFWRRLPPFKRTFEATWKAVTLYWVATEATRWVPLLVASILGLRVDFDSSDNEHVEQPKGFVWKVIVVGLVAVLCAIHFLIPTHVVLVRVQASILPEDTETIVPFDRSFEGTVEPAVVGGKGYVTMRDAWKTFSRSAWRRIVKLYVKIYAISLAFGLFFGLVIGGQVALILSNAKQVEHPQGN
ncbi:hypothetical protein NLU13_0530 [Sarocladium strictum]|uniref:Ubiquitin carrier protein n=1 Tax=Sarocladium strictum TaxID=5046 RepID=A0AA39GP81_SARSR|nr:hypothetical protein NLU13_0530 [Sarocladium strictum]